MCSTCADVKRIGRLVHARALEKNRLRPEPFPVCEHCETVVHPDDVHEMYGRRCLTCGVSKLEKLFFRLWSARGRRARRRALRRIARLARQ